jgi:hypothetical protein
MGTVKEGKLELTFLQASARQLILQGLLPLFGVERIGQKG